MRERVLAACADEEEAGWCGAEVGGEVLPGPLVRAQLEEGEIEAAWADAVDGGCEVRLWRQSADARRERHPDESIGVYRRLLDQVLEQADVRAYREAVALLREIQKTLTDHARAEEFVDDVERIREAHRRRPKLLSLLAVEG